jgi:hypothetical protein
MALLLDTNHTWQPGLNPAADAACRGTLVFAKPRDSHFALAARSVR